MPLAETMPVEEPPPPSRGWIAGVTLLGLLGAGAAAWWAWPRNAPADEAVTVAQQRAEAERTSERSPDAPKPEAIPDEPGPQVEPEPTAPVAAVTPDPPEPAPEPEPEIKAETSTNAKADKRSTHKKGPRYATLGGLRRTAKKQCKTGTPGGKVAVRFTIDGTGIAGMTADAGSSDDRARIDCVIRVIERARFEPGELRNQVLRVEF
jgi:hypothetical protein